MKAITIGLGIQGHKRVAVAGDDIVATVDPENPAADYKRVEDVPLADFDVALVCTPDEAKIELLNYLLENGKHLLVEKPVVTENSKDIEHLLALSRENGVTCYTAYNHRFEPHIVRMKNLLESGALGQIYLARLFYGNGTAREVRNSPWRDRGAGVLPDLGSHLIDMALFLFGPTETEFVAMDFNRFENKAFDHFLFDSQGLPVLRMEMTLLSWRNHFTCDVYGEKGSAHIQSLCKWGPSTFTKYTRVLPSGRPAEETIIEEEGDPTWAAEYEHFKGLCARGGNNLENDIFINDALRSLTRQSLEVSPE